jgi:hypothetical protein
MTNEDAVWLINTWMLDKDKIDHRIKQDVYLTQKCCVFANKKAALRYGIAVYSNMWRF